MLTEQQLQERSIHGLKQIQAALRGVGTDKEQFDRVGKVLKEKGAEGLSWVKETNTGPIGDSYKEKKAKRAEFSRRWQEIRDDETIDEVTRLNLLVGSKHSQLYYSATSRGKDFNLRLVDVHKLITAKKCAYTGIALTDEVGLGFRTIDRIDADKGYVRGNVVAVSSVANNLKNAVLEGGDSSFSMSEDELLAFAINMVKLAGK